MLGFWTVACKRSHHGKLTASYLRSEASSLIWIKHGSAVNQQPAKIGAVAQVLNAGFRPIYGIRLGTRLSAFDRCIASMQP